MIDNRLKKERIKGDLLAGNRKKAVEKKNSGGDEGKGRRDLRKKNKGRKKMGEEWNAGRGEKTGDRKNIEDKKIWDGEKSEYGKKPEDKEIRSKEKSGYGKKTGDKEIKNKGKSECGKKPGDKKIEYGKRMEDKNKGDREKTGAGRKNREVGKARKKTGQCSVSDRCGGCQLLGMPYNKQLELKKKRLEELLRPYCKVSSMMGMENPYHYRNKVHAVFDHDKKGNAISGFYEAKSHRVVPVDSCLIDDERSDQIIVTIRDMLKSFKIRTFDEDSGYGLLRHVLIRRGFATGEIMVILVTASPVFPSKNNFVNALRGKHPEITTIIQNINGRGTNLVLGEKEHVLYGKGYIEDILCGCRFRISSKSFYQVNPVQTEVLYEKVINTAGLTGKERVLDAYCGIGTIGIVASRNAKEVIGVELNSDAVRDAKENARINGIRNIRFFCNDAGKFLVDMANNNEEIDVVFMDPPRSGSTEEFINSVAQIKPQKVVYISCNPVTLVRDLECFRKRGYEVRGAWGVDMFAWTGHVETIVGLHRRDT